jgi:hypothetical protein
LKRHPADLRRLGARRAFVNRRQSQKPPGLRPVLRPPGRTSHHLSIIIAPKRNGRGEPPPVATLNQSPADSGIPNRVIPSEIWYKLVVDIRSEKQDIHSANLRVLCHKRPQKT